MSPSKFNPNKNHTATLIAYYAALAALGMHAAVFGPALSNLAANTHTTWAQISLILALGPFGYLAGTLVAGRVFDRFPGHPVMASAVLMAGAATALTPLMSWLWALVLVVMILGLADGLMDVGTNTLLPWIYGKRSGPYLNGLHFFFGVGGMAAPQAVAQAIKWSGSIRWAFWGFGLAMLPLAAALTRLPSPPHRPEPVRGKAPAFNHKLALLIMLIFLSYCAVEMGFVNWIFNYAKTARMEDENGAANLTSLFWGTLTLGRLAAIFILLRVSSRMVLAVDAAGSVLSLGLLLAWPGSHPALWLGTGCAGFFMASIFPTLLAYAGRRLSPQSRISGSVTSIFFVGGSVGSIILPWVIGQGFEPVGPRMVMISLFAVVLVMAGLILWLLLSEPVKKSLQK